MNPRPCGLHELLFPVGAAVMGPHDAARLVSVDTDGVLWVLAFGTRRQCFKWASSHHIVWWRSLGELVAALEDGRCVGIVRELWFWTVLVAYD